MIYTLIAPEGFPITLAEAKRECRITDDDTSHDDDLTAYIASATSICQKRACQQFVTATLRQIIHPKCNVVSIDRVPFGGVVSLEDQDGEEVGYELDLTRLRPRLILDRVPETLTIDFTAGYGSTEEIPQNIKTGVAKVTRHLWLRQDQTPIPTDLLDALLDSVRWY